MRQQKERASLPRPRVEVDFVGPAGPVLVCIQEITDLMERFCDVLEVYDCEAPETLRDDLHGKAVELKTLAAEVMRLQPAAASEGSRDRGCAAGDQGNEVAARMREEVR